jgi:hypothetical protein
MSPLYLGGSGQQVELQNAQRLYRGGTGELLFERATVAPGVPDVGPELVWSGTPTFVDSPRGKAWSNATAVLPGQISTPSPSPSTDWTVQAWVQATGSLDTRTRNIVSGGSSATALGLGVSRATAGAKPSFQVGTLVMNYGSTPYPMGEWVHLASCKQGNNVKFWMNGVQQGSTTGGIGVALPSLLQLGASFAFNSNNRFIGLIDEIEVSKVARYWAPFTPAEIVPDANTLLFYQFDLAA